MRVLHVVHTYPPDSHGGIERYVQRLAQQQQADGYRVLVVAARDARSGERATDAVHDGVPVHWLPPHRFSMESTLRDERVLAALTAVVDREHADVVHLHHWHNIGIDIAARCKARGVATVVTLHDYFAICPRFFRMRNEAICAPDVGREVCVACVREEFDVSVDWLRATLVDRESTLIEELRLAGAVIALSEDQRDYLKRVPGLDARIEILPFPRLELNGVASPAVVPPESHGAARLVSWGGLVPGKGLHVLVAACEQLEDTVAVHHYGRQIDADYAERLQKLAVRTRLHLHGPFDEASAGRELAAFDLAVFPSLYRETHGVVVDEALQLGLPVVVPDRGAPRQRIGTRGATFRAGDADHLAAVLRDTLQPDRLRELRSGTPRLGPSMPAHAGRLQAVYERAIS